MKNQANPIYLAYAKSYVTAFKTWQNSGTPNAREKAAEAGKRAFSYIIQAKAFEESGSFIGALMASTQDPYLLQTIIDGLQTLVAQVSEKDYWLLCGYLASAYQRVGQTENALPLYAKAITKAEAAEYWADASGIYQNWANALAYTGELSQARQIFQRSIESAKKADNLVLNMVISKLEILRIDVIQGQAKQALPKIEQKVAQIRQWWQLRQQGKSVVEVTKMALLEHGLLGGLSILNDANWALQRWQAYLDVLDEVESIQKKLGENEHVLARTNFSRYYPLLNLERLEPAQKILEQCLPIYVYK